jgi:hypothetical protein
MPKSAPSPSRARTAPASFERHRRKCAVCHHPEREAIEDYFIHWFRPGWIAAQFQISEDSLHRHVFATRLYAARSSRVRFALEHIIERVNQAPVTAASVVDAVRAYTRIDESGHWSEPPTTHFVVPASAPSAARLISTRAPELKAAPEPPTGPQVSLEPAVSGHLDLSLPPQISSRESLAPDRGKGELENAGTR